MNIVSGPDCQVSPSLKIPLANDVKKFIGKH